MPSSTTRTRRRPRIITQHDPAPPSSSTPAEPAQRRRRPFAEAWTELKGGMQRAFRKLARDDIRADEEAIKRIRILSEDVETLTHDVTRLIPQMMDVLDGLLRDPDELLTHDPEAYEKIFDDDQIACSIDNAFLPVTEAKFTLEAQGDGSRELIAIVRDKAINVPGWKDLILDLCYAEITGIRIVRKVWRNEGTERAPVWVIKEFALKDKRRFRPADPDWENMFLVDGGTTPVGISGAWGLTSTRKPLDRRHFILHRWRSTEDRLGWGKNTAPRLYRLARYRRPLIHILMQFLENNAGGIRYVETMLEGLINKTADEQRSWMNLVEDQISNAISGDTVVLPPGASIKAFFPPAEAGNVVQNAVDGYIDSQVSKTMLGATLTEDQTRVGSYALGKEHSKTVHHRLQVRGERIAETLERDYIEHFLELNPWAYDQAGVQRGTATPRLTALVPGGDSLAEKVAVYNQIKVPMFKAQYAREFGLDEATDEDVNSGAAFVPALVEATIAARGMDVPGVDEFGNEDHPVLGGARGGFGVGAPAAGGGGGGGGGNAPASPPEVDATGKQTVDGVPVAAQGVEAPSIQEASLMAERMGKIGDRVMYELARGQLAVLMGQGKPLPLSDEEWDKISGAGAGGAGGPGGLNSPPLGPPGAAGGAPPNGKGNGAVSKPAPKPPAEPVDQRGERPAPWWEAPGAHRDDWREEDHPRDDDGQFTLGGGGGSSGKAGGGGKPASSSKPSKREQKQAREQRYRDNPIDTKTPPSEVKVVKTLTQDKARKSLQKLGYSKEEATAAAMAIDRYTYIFDRVIRDAQRDRGAVAKQHGEGIAREAEFHAQNLEAMMRRNPAERQTLYRGFRDLRSHMFGKLNIGDVFQLDSAMASTSSDRAAAEGFAIGDDSVMVEIRGGVPHSFDVGDMGNFDVESEVLVASKTRLRIVEMNRRTGHIVCEYTTDTETKKGVLRAKQQPQTASPVDRQAESVGRQDRRESAHRRAGEGRRPKGRDARSDHG